MNVPTKEEILTLTQNVFDAVDVSSFGPIFMYPDQTDPMNKQINQVAFGVYSIILTGLLKHLS